MNKIKVAAAIIENNKKELLITKRPVGKSYAGLWEFAGGKIERDETHRQTLLRELQEELNLDLEAETFFHFAHVENEALKIDFYFCCLRQEISPQPMENQEIKWVSYSELLQYPFIGTNEIVIRKLIKNL